MIFETIAALVIGFTLMAIPFRPIQDIGLLFLVGAFAVPIHDLFFDD